MHNSKGLTSHRRSGVGCCVHATVLRWAIPGGMKPGCSNAATAHHTLTGCTGGTLVSAFLACRPRNASPVAAGTVGVCCRGMTYCSLLRYGLGHSALDTVSVKPALLAQNAHPRYLHRLDARHLSRLSPEASTVRRNVAAPATVCRTAFCRCKVGGTQVDVITCGHTANTSGCGRLGSLQKPTRRGRQ